MAGSRAWAEATVMNTNRTTTITVRGHQIRSRSNRRYIVVSVRPEAITIHPGDVYEREPGTYVAFARIEKRTDSAATARTHQRRFRDGRYAGIGVYYVIVDTVTGEEVA